MDDRRRATRRDISERERCPFEYKIVNGGFFQKNMVALTKNISASGLLFISSKLYAPGTLFKAKLALPGAPKPIKLKAKVIRTEPTKNPRVNKIAITFTEIKPEDQAYIETFCQELKSDKSQLEQGKDYQIYL